MTRKGFSLIELLIVVAIIAALVGVAVPFFQDNLQQAQQTKAKQDLDTIRNAISLHDAQNRPLIGTSLQPLLGRYLQELPRDPWGNEYALDANTGLIISFGADAQAGGNGGDTDQYFYYKPPIKIQRAQYIGPWGRPTTSNKLVLTLTKPYDFDGPANMTLINSDLMLLRNTRDVINGLSVSFATLEGSFGHDWELDRFTTATSNPGLLDPITGVLCVTNNTTVHGSGQSITPTMAVNFNSVTAVGQLYSQFGLTERWLRNGPLDAAIYGPKVNQYRRPPEAIPAYGVGGDKRNRGVKIERF